MLLYAITDGQAAAGELSPAAARERLTHQACQWAQAGVDYVQLREKRLAPAELAALVRSIARAIQECRPDSAPSPGLGTKLLVNIDALAQIDDLLEWDPGAAGVHLPASVLATAGDAHLAQVAAALHARGGQLSVACHSPADVVRAAMLGADLALFAPVFEKPLPGEPSLPGVGLDRLAGACRAAPDLPVIALGGVTVDNAADCLRHGAAGVAAIRLFSARGGWQKLARSRFLGRQVASAGGPQVV